MMNEREMILYLILQEHVMRCLKRIIFGDKLDISTETAFCRISFIDDYT